MACLALTVDTGYMYTMQTRLDRAVDAAALAGTSVLIDGQSAAEDMVVEYLVRNPLDTRDAIEVDGTMSTIKADWLTEHQEELELTYGYWNHETRQLESSLEPSAVKVVHARAQLPLFFARALGRDSFELTSSAIATYKPRDIIVVLDLSASMNDDSEFRSIGTLGREIVEGNLEQIYYELGQPVYGNMTTTPEYATVIGEPPAAGILPQITVEYRGDSIYITSTKDISNVWLELEDGTSMRDESFGDGTLTATMDAGQTILCAYVKSGQNAQYFEHTNGLGELFDFTDNNTFIEALELTDVPYPYPSGSWSDYINYVKSAGNSNDSAGYQYKFGYLNLVNYWLECQPAHSQTPDLKNVSAQPLATVKDAVSLFADYVREVYTRDRIGLVVFNSSTGEGSVEVSLTEDLDQSVTTAQARQAGHYHMATNIGGGLHSAIDELLQNGRDGAFQMIVVLADGDANFVNGTHDSVAARDYVIAEANRAYQEKQKVMTISLGLGADTTLMQEVADIAEGMHYNVPGGRSVGEVSADLIDAFREIARQRPVMLVE
jgi:Flp pilus assembly protein TadG